jgi:CubicO group peptidase (beta-lactamase class C family)
VTVRSAVRASDVVRAGIGTRYTSAVLRVQRHGRAVFEAAYGALDADPNARPTEVDTRFDLASLTKTYVGTAVLFGVMEGEIALDATASRWLGEWRDAPHVAVTPRMLLAHTAGLQSGADFRTLFDWDVERYARERPLVAAPGTRVTYSDLGFIVLGTLLARARGTSLARACADALSRMGCDATAYRPRNDAPLAVPATECDAWRGRVRGAVHDEKAYLMHGVAGHAGLFGTARDVGTLAETYLGAVHGRPSALSHALAEDALAEQGADPVLRRGLAWALKTSDANSCGSAMDRSTFGHTGFTGTCVWADPVRDLCVVLLTNAVYFGRNDLRDVRAAVCDACVAEFG